MSLEALTGPALAASALLLVCVVSLWTTTLVWGAAFVAVVVAGYATGVMHPPALVWLAIVARASWRLRDATGWPRALWIVVAGTAGVLLGLHVLPGFVNPIVLREAVLAPDARPYSQYVNFDKTLAGVLLLGCSGWTPLRGARAWLTTIRDAAPFAAATIFVVMAASVAVGFVSFEPRPPVLFHVWAPLNLLTTCVSEEAFFRGLVQHELQQGLRRRAPAWLAIVVSALAFGVAHAAGGWTYVALATLAGCGYALAFARTRRLEAAVLTHFSVNAVHFLLFTYPAIR